MTRKGAALCVALFLMRLASNLEAKERESKMSDDMRSVLGVPGRFTHETVKPGQAPGLWFKQVWISTLRRCPSYDESALRQAFIRAEIRFDDECGNGHNTFTITGTIKTEGGRVLAGGCLHEEIALAFPELAPLIQWHLCASDGPLHYVANTLFHAGDRDHNGLRKGERRQIINGRTNKPAWHLAWIDSGVERPLHEMPKQIDGEKPEHNPVVEWRAWYREGEGKARELDHARSSAVWPEATDAELSVDREVLRAVLVARLPALQERLRAAIEGAGFKWEPPAQPTAD
jgi:hypothetical protein